MKTLIIFLLLIAGASYGQTHHYVPIGGGGTGVGTLGVKLTADTATTGQALIASPVKFTFTASQKWAFDIYAIVNSSSSAGLKVGLRFPVTDTVVAQVLATDTNVTQLRYETLSTDSGLSLAHTQLNGDGYVHIHGVITGPTGGAVSLGFLKVTSGTATIKKGSYAIWKRF